MKIGQLEKKLLKKFPASTACEGDSTGLLVGDPNVTIKRVAVALDPTPQAITKAAEAGCNVLLTHHPLFFQDAKFSKIQPNELANKQIENAIYCAIKNDVALMNFHTALDVSAEGGAMLPSMLGLKSGKAVVPVCTTSRLGYGRYVQSRSTVGDLALKCIEVFGRNPRTWGNLESRAVLCATTTGSTGSINDPHGLLCRCIDNDVDVLICGEIKYHDALAAQNAGLNIIELGHDVSELPLVKVLKEQCILAGIAKSKIAEIDQSHNWI